MDYREELRLLEQSLNLLTEQVEVNAKLEAQAEQGESNVVPIMVPEPPSWRKMSQVLDVANRMLDIAQTAALLDDGD
jgi:hypothetical protein